MTGKRIIILSPESVAMFLTEGNAIRIVEGLPRGSKLVGSGFSAYPYNRFELVFESAAWPEMIEGEAIPIINPSFVYVSHSHQE